MRADLDLNIPYVEIRKITATSGDVTGTVAVNKNNKLTQITVKRNSDLKSLSGNNLYDGWIVEDIYGTSEEVSGRIQFTNGRVLYIGSNTGLEKDLLQRAQIRATIQDHFETELKLRQRAEVGQIHPTKPLSLFFIDRVANYALPESKFRLWFEEEYEGVKSLRKFRNLDFPEAKEVHKGYFASSKSVAKDSKEGKGNKEDEEAFNLIMKSKETLLSLEEPVRFIFSHSALAEGWDNPNVFTICNLQESKSDVKRRQQIGRGLRLPVMSNGERCREDEVNRLTVIATESFETFVQNLQSEISDETGIKFEGLIGNKRDRVELTPKEDYWKVPGFQDLWNLISTRTKYELKFESDALQIEATRRLKGLPAISESRFRVSKHRIERVDALSGVVEGSVQIYESKPVAQKGDFPDILSQLSDVTPISRSTIRKIILQSGRLEEGKKNPAEFISQVKSAIFGALAATLKDHDGIHYTPILSGENSRWNMEFFSSRISSAYEKSLVTVKKSIYERIPVDSNIEKDFAIKLDSREDIEFFLKLPSWFKIDTPVGGYNPDWAIVRVIEDGSKRVYLVRETKGTTSLDELFRESEVWKVVFGSEHFKSIDVNYKMVKEASDLDKDEYLVLSSGDWHGERNGSLKES
jgi:type III restriction enzyme